MESRERTTPLWLATASCWRRISRSCATNPSRGTVAGSTESSHAAEVRGGGEARVRTDAGYTVHCKSVVVATSSPINERIAIHTKQAAYMTYVIAAPMPHGAVTPALFWDTEDPYHYVRVQQEEARRLSRRARTAPRALGGLHASRLRRHLERWGEDLGLPVSRVALRPLRCGAQRAREHRPLTDEAGR